VGRHALRQAQDKEAGPYVNIPSIRRNMETLPGPAGIIALLPAGFLL